MKTRVIYKSSLAILLMVALITSCKKDDKKDEIPSPQEVLTANAGPDQSTDVATTVTLDGTASTSSLNKTFQYKWTISSKPAGSVAVLLNNTQVQPIFVPDMVGSYELTLTITNSSGQSSDKVVINVGASQPVILPQSVDVETILVDRVADPLLPDYIVSKDIAINTELTINPGVVIQFERDTRMDINEHGVLNAEGSEDKKIVFTGKEQTKGYWKGITIFSNGSGNVLEYVEILNAGSIPGLNTIKAALTLFGISHATVSINHCLISNSGGYGLHAASGSVIGSFGSNSFTLNKEAGVLMGSENVPKLDPQSVFTGSNGRDVVEILQSNLSSSTNAEVVWQGFDDHTPYRLIGDLSVTTGWKLMPGTIVESGSQVTIEIDDPGYINAVGTSELPIVFTGSYKVIGYWKGIRTYSTSPLNKLEYTTISYAGSSPIVSGKKASIAIYGAQSLLSVKNSKINYSNGYGIFVSRNSTLNTDAATSNVFENNTQDNIYKE